LDNTNIWIDIPTEEFAKGYPHAPLPCYSSDGKVWWTTGADAAVALLGPGVDTLHNYEHTHTDAPVGTARWVAAYLLEE
jgi:putative aminopeptidase FrvX